MPTLVEDQRLRGMHVYVPIVRGPTQKQVWRSPRRSPGTAPRHPKLITAEYRVAQRPAGGCCRLQPERLGPHVGLGLFGAAEAAGDRSAPVTWEEVSPGRRDRRFPHRQHAGALAGSR